MVLVVHPWSDCDPACGNFQLCCYVNILSAFDFRVYRSWDAQPLCPLKFHPRFCLEVSLLLSSLRDSFGLDSNGCRFGMVTLPVLTAESRPYFLCSVVLCVHRRSPLLRSRTVSTWGSRNACDLVPDECCPLGHLFSIAKNGGEGQYWHRVAWTV